MRFQWGIALIFCILSGWTFYGCKDLTTLHLSAAEPPVYSGTYLYGTDNHLSTEGVAIHTDRIIAALKVQLAAEEKEGTP